MSLDDDQRKWLDAALKSKGRFTRSKAIREDWEDFRRRRAKVATLLGSMDANAPQKPIIEQGLVDADALAKVGKFSDAYKTLDKVKARAKTTNPAKLGAIAVASISAKLDQLATDATTVRAQVGRALGDMRGLLARVQAMPTAEQQRDQEAAFAYLRSFLKDVEPALQLERNALMDTAGTVEVVVQNKKLAEAIAAIESEIETATRAGVADEIRPYADRLDVIKGQLQGEGGAYLDSNKVQSQRFDLKRDIGAAIEAIRKIGKFQNLDGDGVTRDAKSAQARGRLAHDEADHFFVEIEDEFRLDRAVQKMKADGIKDAQLVTTTGRGAVNPAPEPKSFDADLVLAGLLDDDEELPEDLPFDKADALVATARTEMKKVVKQLNPKGDELFDLLLKTPEELATMCSVKLTGIEKPGGFSQSHAACFKKMADAMRAEILANSPNKMADDKSKIAVGGVDYDLEETLGEGGFGAVRRYRDPNTGKTVVVKSLLEGDTTKALADIDKKLSTETDKEERVKLEERRTALAKTLQKKRAAMVAEMQTHRRALNDDDTQPGANNLVGMEGAAVSEDGSLHLMLEDAEGGDMTLAGNALLELERNGILPPEARQAIAQDMIRQAVLGMKAMEARGLVHNDMKPANMMITADGTVKIIDFGESRFGDDTGEAVTQEEGKFNLTPGFASPEVQGEVDKPVTARSDAFALQGIIRALGGPDMDQSLATDHKVEAKPTTALGRLAKALADPDPDKRPSLDAVLASTYLNSATADHPEEDVKDLKAAAAEMNAAVARLRTPISAQDYKDNKSSRFDGSWKAFDEEVSTKGADLPVSLLQTMATALDGQIRENYARMAKATSDEAAYYRDLIAKLEQKKKFWEKQISTTLDEQRVAGKAAYDAALKDASKTLAVPGKDGGTLTLSKAVELRDKRLREIKALQDRFYTLVSDDPEKAAAKMDEVNAFLQNMDAQVKAIDAAVKGALGDAAKYYLAEQAVAEVSARFGPRKTTPDELSAKATRELAIRDPANTVDVPGKDGGRMTLAQAVGLRDQRLAQIKALEEKFQTLADKDPDSAAAKKDQFAAAVRQGHEQVRAINAAVDEAVAKVIGA